MKKIFFFLSLLALISYTSEAKIWRLNNNVGVLADFTSAQQAHNSGTVNAGDTLYFEHSANGYGDLVMTKGLKLIGDGYFLTLTPNLQYNLNVSYLGNIMIRPTASNTVISVACLSLIDSASNVSIVRCKTGAIDFRGVNTCTVANCFIDGGITFKAYVINSATCSMVGCTSMSIYNNIIYSGNISQDALAFWWPSLGASCQSWVMPHSVTAFNNSVSGFINITGFVYNNICGNIITDGSTGVTNNVFHNPKTSSTRTTYLPAANLSTIELEAGNGNQFSIVNTTLYTGTIFANDTSWHLKPSAVAIGAGTGGADCGSTGGSNPYLFGVQPAIPAIYKLNVAPAPSGNSIGVTISTRSNN